jgi:hypothetical protein
MVAGKDKPARRRGPKGDTKRVMRIDILPANAPLGSRFKGYRDCVVRDLIVRPDVVRYRRECWVTPDGHTMIAPLPAGVKGGYGANLRRFCLMLHSHGQVTTQSPDDPAQRCRCGNIQTPSHPVSDARAGWLSCRGCCRAACRPGLGALCHGRRHRCASWQSQFSYDADRGANIFAPFARRRRNRG